MTTTEAPRGATALSERALGPDLARGSMLLFIALANSHYFLDAPSVLGGYPRGGSALDGVVTWLVATFVDGRAFPMFGLLFGYGIAQVVRRHEGAGRRAVRRVLWRRSAFLVVVGTAHALLLFVGDVIAAYGVLLLLGAWVVHWKDRWLVAPAVVLLAMISLPSDDSLTTSTLGPSASMVPPDVWTMLVARAQDAPYVSLLGPIGFAAPFLLGLWAGRRRVLEQPERHRRLLLVTAVGGIGAAVLGAQPIAVVLAGWRRVPDATTLSVIGPLHDSTGFLGGLGYAALAALLARRLGRGGPDRQGPVVRAVAAAGQRSMTCYLAQSVVWMVVFTPFLLDLSRTLTVTTTALLASATWVATVLLADRMGRAGRRGPFEVALRRATYRTRG